MDAWSVGSDSESSWGGWPFQLQAPLSGDCGPSSPGLIGLDWKTCAKPTWVLVSQILEILPRGCFVAVADSNMFLTRFLVLFSMMIQFLIILRVHPTQKMTVLNLQIWWQINKWASCGVKHSRQKAQIHSNSFFKFTEKADFCGHILADPLTAGFGISNLYFIIEVNIVE